ncbi:galanin-like G-protein coupled receptor npr-9 [Physella acuta]|uniref:galanin-like G-protein coupled receptor npr-9 n=1 Tax=Physella acuta TaxID=109671 RepID=UPI0027DCFD78|nr:galanin-like G-protein coupled receptor npr-9 [Physella acuta]
MEYKNNSIVADAMFDISKTDLFYINLIFSGIILPALCFTGIVGNSLTILILVYNGLRETTTIILTALAVSDLFFSLTQLHFPLENLARLIDDAVFYYIFSHFTAYVLGWNQYAICTSVQMATVIAVERMIAVVFPFAASKLLTTFRIKCIVVSFYIISAGF